MTAPLLIKSHDKSKFDSTKVISGELRILFNLLVGHGQSVMERNIDDSKAAALESPPAE